MKGTIARVVVDKNFGFITSDEDGKDYFFHKSVLINSESFTQALKGLTVTFEPQQSEKGLRADEVFLD